MERETLKKIGLSLYQDRDDCSIKNDYGKCLLIGGCKQYCNSILISSYFASLSGTGYVSLGVPSSIYQIVASCSYETNVFEISKDKADYISFEKNQFNKILSTYTSILYGNGILDCQENYSLLVSLINEYKGNMIIDATGLRMLSRINDYKFAGNVLLTPHLGEANALFSCDLHTRDAKAYVELAKKYCVQHNCDILLKSNRSILVSKDGKVESAVDIDSTSLAKAGSGDGLAGYLAGLLSYATKKIDFDDIVIFGDYVIHKSAYFAQKDSLIGLEDIISCKQKIKDVLLDLIK